MKAGVAFALLVIACDQLIGCDQGVPLDQSTVGPPLELTGANVGPNLPLPIDGTILITFNRLLLPSSVIRQSLAIADSFNQVGSPLITYDPIARMVSIANPALDGGAWFITGQPYRLFFATQGGEPKSLDGATLPRRPPLGFYTVPAAGEVPPPKVDYCDVAPIFQAKCASCHGGARTEAALRLDSVAGVSDAIGRIAHSNNTGPSVRAREVDRLADQAIIDPASPGTSVLVYKLLMAPRSADAAEVSSCRPKIDVRVPEELPASERSLVRDFVLGEPMPREGSLHPADLVRIGRWIAGGAAVHECGSCP